jgi:hypothetical protein
MGFAGGAETAVVAHVRRYWNLLTTQIGLSLDRAPDVVKVRLNRDTGSLPPTVPWMKCTYPDDAFRGSPSKRTGLCQGPS